MEASSSAHPTHTEDSGSVRTTPMCSGLGGGELSVVFDDKLRILWEGPPEGLELTRLLQLGVAAGSLERGGPRLCATGAGMKLPRKQRMRQADLNLALHRCAWT